MRKFLYLIMFTLIMVSCGTDSRHFKIDGRLLHLNQGEFYVYSPDGTMQGLDTIKVQAGRFSYELECNREMTLMIVFPNFTEQPVFAAPGKSVDIKGDASHLKEMTVKGTKDNELMNSFRDQIASASPEETKNYARQFIEDHPESAVSTYLVRRYFIQTPTPDFHSASRMIAAMLAKRPDNASLLALQRQIAGKTVSSPGKAAPSFTAYDINGKLISNSALFESSTVVVIAWTTWNFNSLAMLRNVCALQKDNPGTFSIIGISLDYSKAQCRSKLNVNDLSSITTLCDGKSVDGDLYNRLGLSNVPDNIVFRDGKIVAASLSLEELRSQLQKKVTH